MNFIELEFFLDKQGDIGYSCFVGLGRRLVPADQLMPESPLLFSSVVPASGFCLQVQLRSRGVKDLRSGRPRADHTARAAGQKVGEGFPTSRLLNFSTAKSGEQSENVYENKG
jgi:hypothetical protein